MRDAPNQKLQKKVLRIYGVYITAGFLLGGTALWIAATALNPSAGGLILLTGIGSLLASYLLNIGLGTVRKEINRVLQQHHTGHGASTLPALFLGLGGYYLIDFMAAQCVFATALAIYAAAGAVGGAIGGLCSYKLHHRATWPAVVMSIIAGAGAGATIAVVAPLASVALAAYAEITLGTTEAVAMNIVIALPLVILANILVDGVLGQIYAKTTTSYI